MTVNELLLEIANRTGEGFQDYTDRIKSAYRKAVITLMKSGLFSYNDYPASVFRSEYVATGNISNIPIQTLMQDDMEFIDFDKLTYLEDDLTSGYIEYPISLVTYSEYQAYLLNTALIPDTNKIAYYLNDSGSIGIIISIAEGDKIQYVLLVWSDAWLRNDIADEGLVTEIDYGKYVIDSYWSGSFREYAIDRAVEILRAEIEKN